LRFSGSVVRLLAASVLLMYRKSDKYILFCTTTTRNVRESVVTLEAPAVMINAFRNCIHKRKRKSLLWRLKCRDLLYGVYLVDG
jgi:hypothetical protein